jgi:hypothetical protein
MQGLSLVITPHMSHGLDSQPDFSKSLDQAVNPFIVFMLQ